MGQKNFKGAVSIINDNGRVRLRWRYQAQRYSFSLSIYNKQNILQAKKVALLIEQDISREKFDFTLNRYKNKPEILKKFGHIILWRI
jgi:integrase